jgi:hypothetical protein
VHDVGWPFEQFHDELLTLEVVGDIEVDEKPLNKYKVPSTFSIFSSGKVLLLLAERGGGWWGGEEGAKAVSCRLETGCLCCPSGDLEAFFFLPADCGGEGEED